MDKMDFSGKSLLSIIHVGFMHYSEEKVSFHLKRKRETLKQEEDSWNKIWLTLNMQRDRSESPAPLSVCFSLWQPDLQHAVWKEMRRIRYCVFIWKRVTPFVALTSEILQKAPAFMKKVKEMPQCLLVTRWPLASFTVTPSRTSASDEFYEAQREEQEYFFIFFVPVLCE